MATIEDKLIELNQKITQDIRLKNLTQLDPDRDLSDERYLTYEVKQRSRFLEVQVDILYNPETDLFTPCMYASHSTQAGHENIKRIEKKIAEYANRLGYETIDPTTRQQGFRRHYEFEANFEKESVAHTKEKLVEILKYIANPSQRETMSNKKEKTRKTHYKMQELFPLDHIEEVLTGVEELNIYPQELNHRQKVLAKAYY